MKREKIATETTETTEKYNEKNAVIPAKVGTQFRVERIYKNWIPAFAGMTVFFLNIFFPWFLWFPWQLLILFFVFFVCFRGYFFTFHFSPFTFHFSL